MTDDLGTALRSLSDDLTRDRPVPSVRPVLRRGRRRARIRLILPIVAVAVVATVVAVPFVSQHDGKPKLSMAAPITLAGALTVSPVADAAPRITEQEARAIMLNSQNAPPFSPPEPARYGPVQLVLGRVTWEPGLSGAPTKGSDLAWVAIWRGRFASACPAGAIVRPKGLPSPYPPPDGVTRYAFVLDATSGRGLIYSSGFLSCGPVPPGVSVAVKRLP